MPSQVAANRAPLRALALAVAVGVVLADSSVVILALPDILDEFGVTVASLAWIITAFNLVLALSAVPAAYLARRWPRAVCAGGLVVFAAASLACAASGSLHPLVAGRCVQALGGAAAICAALELLPSVVGDEARAARLWATAGVAGAAIGPAAGGILTQLFSWQAIFIVQAPVALVALIGTFVPSREAPVRARVGRPNVAANVALALISAALAAALFLIVLLLTEGWLYSPLAAAITVTVMPVTAALSGRLPGALGSLRSRAVGGAIAVAGGLAGLALLPGAAAGWTVLPQILIGAGLGLTLGALTETALRGRSPQAIHGGWTIASRHLGVVLGLLLLTPVFTGDLERQSKNAELAGTSILLDAPISPRLKIELGASIADVLRRPGGHIPDVGAAFDRHSPPDDQKAAYDVLRVELQDQVDRAATHAFSRSFLYASLLALAALVPCLLARKVDL